MDPFLELMNYSPDPFSPLRQRQDEITAQLIANRGRSMLANSGATMNAAGPAAPAGRGRNPLSADPVLAAQINAASQRRVDASERLHKQKLGQISGDAEAQVAALQALANSRDLMPGTQERLYAQYKAAMNGDLRRPNPLYAGPSAARPAASGINPGNPLASPAELAPGQSGWVGGASGSSFVQAPTQVEGGREAALQRVANGPAERAARARATAALISRSQEGMVGPDGVSQDPVRGSLDRVAAVVNALSPEERASRQQAMQDRMQSRKDQAVAFREQRRNPLSGLAMDGSNPLASAVAFSQATGLPLREAVTLAAQNEETKTKAEISRQQLAGLREETAAKVQEAQSRVDLARMNMEAAKSQTEHDKRMKELEIAELEKDRAHRQAMQELEVKSRSADREAKDLETKATIGATLLGNPLTQEAGASMLSGVTGTPVTPAPRNPLLDIPPQYSAVITNDNGQIDYDKATRLLSDMSVPVAVRAKIAAALPHREGSAVSMTPGSEQWRSRYAGGVDNQLVPQTAHSVLRWNPAYRIFDYLTSK